MMPAPTTTTTSNSRITTQLSLYRYILATHVILFALPVITPGNGNWDPVTGVGSVGDKVEGAPVYTQHSKLYEN